MRLVKPA